MTVALQISSLGLSKMALVVFLILFGVIGARAEREVALANVTRLATGDLFALVGSDCGPTRCMEVSHGTALASLGDGCMCQCRRDTPAFREDQRVCVDQIEECLMATFGRGVTKPQIPYVFLPLKGQIIYPAKEIIFTDVDDAVCAVTSAQYLSGSGWVTLRDLLDNDVPFGLYRDEGSTFLQWRGSPSLHARLDGRLVAVHVLCSAHAPARLVASCAAFRVAGASHNSLLDVRSIPFHAGEIVTTSETSNQSQGLTVLEALAIGVCVLMLIFVYAAGIIFYIHYKQRQRRKDKDPENNTLSTENGSTLGSRIDLDNVMLKTNPLLKMDNFGSDFSHDAGLSDVSEHTENTLDTSPSNSYKFQKMSQHQSSPNNSLNKFQKLNTSVISAMVHTRRLKKPSRPSIRMPTPDKMPDRLQRRSASPDLERAPHSELAIVDCSVENDNDERESRSIGEPVIRRKLYFNPVFFETEHLKDPPPAAVEFLIKIREVMSIAKEKMTSKRFIPILTDIPEEESYHSVDLGWDIPCARRGRRFSVISLKQENSRRAMRCGGCPGCDSREPVQKPTLTRSNSCKSCVSEDYKQKIVRKWLDEVPSPTPTKVAAKPTKSVAKVNGTPRVVSPIPKKIDSERVSSPVPVKLESKKITKSVEPSPKALPKQSSPKKPRILESTEKGQRIEKLTHEPKIVNIVKKQKERTMDEELISMPSAPVPVYTKPVPKQENTVLTKSQISGPIISRSTAVVETIDPSALITAKSRALVQSPTRNAVKSPTKSRSTVKSPSRSPSSSPTSQEKNSPSSHASRRIRKKLPPPPPPPVPPPNPQMSEVESEPEQKTESVKSEEAPIPPEVKVKMEAVIRELNYCRRSDSELTNDEMSEPPSSEPVPPKIVIPVAAAPDHYFSDDNMLADISRKHSFVQREPFVDFDSMERALLKKRRFSLATGPELIQRGDFRPNFDMKTAKETLTRSWRDVRRAVESYHIIPPRDSSVSGSRKSSISEIFIDTSEPLYDNIAKPGPLTIQIRGSPVEIRRTVRDEFDPDTLDRKPRREAKKRVEKILLKSGGSFKYKAPAQGSPPFTPRPEPEFTRKIGSLRQMYEAKTKTQEELMRRPYYDRRGSLPCVGDELAALVKSVKTSEIIRQLEAQKDPKPPIPPKFRRGLELSPKFSKSIRDSPGEKRRSDERERYSQYLKAENIVARRSGRRSNRTRSRRTDLRKIYRTEDSGYLSTDSNESRRRANYLMQLRSKSMLEPSQVPPPPTVVRTPILQHIESDTDDMESVCDGRSESGGESIETDSVFFGHFDESKQMLADLSMPGYQMHRKMRHHEQIDSGFMGETNIILSGDSDSEHRSVISIVTGRDGRLSAASITQLDDSPYKRSVEC